MSRPFRKTITVFLFLSIFYFTNLYSGITGKISGKVVDKVTNEPLVGANVIIQGTNLGAATDNNGDFTILRVPPGIYTVTAMYMGYSKVNINKVRVRIDQTTRLNFQMPQTAVAGKNVTIVAKKEVVKKDVTSSVAVVSADEVKRLPMNDVESLVGLQAGVEEDLSIRGGDADQALFQIDGLTMRDSRNNRPITGIALSAVKEISVERGGFNAEYGQVRSGIINVVTKEGGEKYQGTIT